MKVGAGAGRLTWEVRSSRVLLKSHIVLALKPDFNIPTESHRAHADFQLKVYLGVLWEHEIKGSPSCPDLAASVREAGQEGTETLGVCCFD